MHSFGNVSDSYGVHNSLTALASRIPRLTIVVVSFADLVVTLCQTTAGQSLAHLCLMLFLLFMKTGCAD